MIGQMMGFYTDFYASVHGERMSHQHDAMAMAEAACCKASLGADALALLARTLERGWGAEDDAVLLRTARAGTDSPRCAVR